MARSVQIVFDCRDPAVLSKFYAAALDYKLQDPPAGYGSWEEALKAFGVPQEEWNSASAVVDPQGRGPRIYFQQMDTPKPGKNRLHLDFNVGGGSSAPLDERRKRIDAEVDRLLGLGARTHNTVELPMRSAAEAGEYWVVMQDPEGNEFCVQ
jgi:hypothetical protein